VYMEGKSVLRSPSNRLSWRATQTVECSPKHAQEKFEMNRPIDSNGEVFSSLCRLFQKNKNKPQNPLKALFPGTPICKLFSHNVLVNR
jgi:hypothetical protein